MVKRMCEAVKNEICDLILNLPNEKRKKGNQGNHKRVEYKHIVTAFDIETTRLEDIEQSIMYIWQWHFDVYGTVYGRTWDEFLELFNAINSVLDQRQYIVVYVHNLSYEFQFLSGIYPFQPNQVFAVKSRKVLKANMGHLELRCSYLHSNMSLDEYTHKMGVEHAKISGFDYNKIRYPWTELTSDELEYCVSDVIGLVEAIKIEMHHDGDNLYTIPLTSTGYVRRDVKKALHDAHYRIFKDLFPDWNLYQLLREAFRGGNTHANRYYVGKILNNVYSADRSSSYPDVICNKEFPVKPFFHQGEMSIDEVLHKIRVRHKAVIMRVAFTNIRLHNEFWGCPYISYDKCKVCKEYERDNGRILKASYIETTITDIDLEIIMEEYDWDDIVCYDVYTSSYGKLPRPIIEQNLKYYDAKTSLKGVHGEEIFYMKSKNKLNSIYGMMAQDPVKINIIYSNGEFTLEDTDPEKVLEAYNNKNPFLPYQWGVWTTAWARWALEQGIKAAGETFVYCDTDSVKSLRPINIKDFNEKAKSDSIKSGAHARDPKGQEHYMGIYETEDTYTRFLTWGAKKYAYEYEDGSPHITIAGVSKKFGAKELASKGGLEVLKPGFIFTDANKLESVYNDGNYGTYTMGDNTLYITRNVVLRPTTYQLGITAEYMRLLEYC